MPCRINWYVFRSNRKNSEFIKCNIVHSAPGSGYSLSIQYVVIYKLCCGLIGYIAAMVAIISMNLVGIHIN